MASPALTALVNESPPVARHSRAQGLLLVAAAVGAAAAGGQVIDGLPLIVAAVVAGFVIANTGLATAAASPGIAFCSKSVLRVGIVLLGLRLSIGDVAGLGVSTLGVIMATVSVTFFGVQYIGRRMGLSPALSLLVASGFSICGNSAIASISGASDADDEEVAAAVGLVTLCGTLAIFVVPAFGALLGLSDGQLGVWAGASVQDTAQVIAVASAAGPAVLAVATAVKLTRVLFLAPIVAGVSIWKRREAMGDRASDGRPALLPLFVVGFLATMLLRTTELLPMPALDVGQKLEQYALAAGMVGLGSSVRLTALRQLGMKPLLLGVIAWLIAGGVSLAALSMATIN